MHTDVDRDVHPTVSAVVSRARTTRSPSPMPYHCTALCRTSLTRRSVVETRGVGAVRVPCLAWPWPQSLCCSGIPSPSWVAPTHHALSLRCTARGRWSGTALCSRSVADPLGLDSPGYVRQHGQAAVGETHEATYQSDEIFRTSSGPRLNAELQAMLVSAQTPVTPPPPTTFTS